MCLDYRVLIANDYPKNARIIGLADIIHIHFKEPNHGISQTKKEKPPSSLWP